MIVRLIVCHCFYVVSAVYLYVCVSGCVSIVVCLLVFMHVFVFLCIYLKLRTVKVAFPVFLEMSICCSIRVNMLIYFGGVTVSFDKASNIYNLDQFYTS